MKRIILMITVFALMFPGISSAAQHDYNIANAAGAVVRADINGAYEAVATNNSAATEPASTFANEWWFDTSTNILKQRNNANDAWISVALKDGNGWTSYRQGTQIGTGALLTTDTDTSMAADSDSNVATQKAVKAYVDTENAAQVNTTTGHDHDGSDSKKVIYVNLDMTGIDDGDYLYNNAGTPAGAVLDVDPFPATPSNRDILAYTYNKTELMLHFEGADDSQDFDDDSFVLKTITPTGTSGQMKIENTEKVFGSTSAYFDGGYLTITGDPRLAIGTRDFTVKFRLYPAELASARCQIGHTIAPASLVIHAAQTKMKVACGTDYITQSDTLTAATWHDVEVSRVGTTVTLYINGVSKGTVESSANLTNQITTIGQAGGTCAGALGYMDELRIMIGGALHSTGYTTEVAAFEIEEAWIEAE